MEGARTPGVASRASGNNRHDGGKPPPQLPSARYIKHSPSGTGSSNHNAADSESEDEYGVTAEEQQQQQQLHHHTAASKRSKRSNGE